MQMTNTIIAIAFNQFKLSDRIPQLLLQLLQQMQQQRLMSPFLFSPFTILFPVGILIHPANWLKMKCYD